MQLSLKNDFYMPDYESEKSNYTHFHSSYSFYFVYIDLCAEFITTFSDASLKEDPIHGKLKYMIQMVMPYS